MICCYEMRKGRGSCVEPSSLKNLGSMFDAEAIHAQIPSNIEPNYQQAENLGTIEAAAYAERKRHSTRKDAIS